jgi:aspartyl-tRNA(Asn)/glutamyl-tRNA(Gln) amidotransferase subunit C
MLSKEEVKHIAKLARLGLSESEIEGFQKDLSSILDYIEKLKELDISEIPVTSHSVGLENVMRTDESRVDKGDAGKLLELAPETKAGFIKVKSIF